MALSQQLIDYWNQSSRPAPASPRVSSAPVNSYWRSNKTPVERWMVLTSRKSKASVSAFRGVQLNSGANSKVKPWRAMLCFQGRRYYGGDFPTEREAALRWNELVLKHVGPLASSILNEVPEL